MDRQDLPQQAPHRQWELFSLEGKNRLHTLPSTPGHLSGEDSIMKINKAQINTNNHNHKKQKQENKERFSYGAD